MGSGAVRVITEKTLKTYWEQHSRAERPLKAWFDEVKRANWTTPDQLKAQFPNASIVGDNRIVFNINGNRFRLVAWINYRHQAVYLKWFGTHAQYNRIDVEKVGL